MFYIGNEKRNSREAICDYHSVARDMEEGLVRKIRKKYICRSNLTKDRREWE